MEAIKKEIILLLEKSLKKEFGVEGEIPVKDITNPPNVQWGDFAYPCFDLAKRLKASPAVIAMRLANVVKESGCVGLAQAKGPYLNLFINKDLLNALIIDNILKNKKGKKQKGKIMIEYSSPNPCKTFHVGHLRNTVLGSSLINIYKDRGFDIISANYLNDTGVHVAKVIWIYLKKYKNKEPKKNRGKWLGDLYVKANALLEENEKYKNEISAVHRKVESKDKEITKILDKFKKWSQQEFDRIYKQLNAKFDKYFYDSDYIAKGKEIVGELLDKGIAQKSQGAVIVNLEKYGLHTLIILKSDESAVYITKDFAMAKDRFKKHKVNKLIYIVGSEQITHFKQLFKILELYGFKQARDCVHLPYELVRLESGKISSRAGGAPLYADIYDKAHKFAFDETKKRHKGWTEKKIQNTAGKIALSALKFAMLKYDTSRVIVFDIKKALAITGDTGPYILYTYARLNSVLKRLGKVKTPKADYSLLNSTEEQDMLNHLGRFEETVNEALYLNKPSLVANYLLELSHKFNHFYHIHSVIKSEQNLRFARFKMLNAVKKVFEKNLRLLNIDAVKEM